MEDPSGSSLTFIAISSFVLSAFCSLAKGAQAWFSPVLLEEILETERARQNLKTFLEKSSQMRITATVVGTIANIAFLLSMILQLSEHGSVKNEKLLYALFLSFGFLLVFSKVIPEAIAHHQPEKVMMWVFPWINVFYFLCFWLIWPLHLFSQAATKAIGQQAKTSSTAIEKEILSVVSEGEREGVLQETEKEMITGIMELRDAEVREVMIPRMEMVSVPCTNSISEALQVALDKGHSRVPVYRGNQDEVIGILYLRDLLTHWDDPRKADLKLMEILRKPYFIPESKHIGGLLKDFQDQKLHIAIVLDEYGGTAGLVTVEDILEEIVGEISDEYDFDQPIPISRIEDNVVEVDAKMHVDELNDALQIQLPLDPGYETVGGFLVTAMGSIPHQGDVYTYQNIEFTILNANERQVKRVKVVKKETTSD